MNITVKTPLGEIRGNRKEGYNEWLGIKYADCQRFEDSVPAGPWEGIYDATEIGPLSMQYKGIFGREEFPSQQFYSNARGENPSDFSYTETGLYLNICAPENAENCPVFMYIHGGGYSTGSCSEPTYHGRELAKHGIVTVSVSYRLGMFATANIDGCTGNHALKDQIQAIRWVYDNIEAFGGDSARITVGGESAGAYSVQNLLNTPKLPNGIIKGAIMMSGAGNTSPLDLLADKETHAAIWEDVKKELGVESLQELKNMPAAELYPVWSKASAKHSGFGACPSIDGEYILTTTEKAVNSGQTKDVPLLLGMLSEDMYPILLYKGIMEIADARRKQNGAPVYSYFFDYKVHVKWGAYHAVDIAYAFGLRTELARKVKEEDIRIQQDLFTGFCNFIRCGNPNGRNQCTSGENIACTDSGISNPKGFSKTSCPGSDQSEALSSTWLSMQESDGGFYELNGINHGMYHPDVDTLIKQTEEGQPFPTA